MTDAEREKAIDREVQRRLATDPRYRYAENAEEQAEAEAAIGREAEDYIDTRVRLAATAGS